MTTGAVVTHPATPAPAVQPSFWQANASWLIPLLIIIILYLWSRQQAGVQSGVSKIANTETIEWTDVFGNPQKMVIKRDVTAS